MNEYLKVDSTRLSFSEYWRWKPGLPFLILAGRKLLRWRLPSTVMVPAVASLDLVEPRTQSQDLVAALADAIAACKPRGRTVQFWHTVPAIGSNVGLGVALASQDGLSLAMAVVGQTKSGMYRSVVLGLVSRLRGGRFLTTGQGKSLFNPAPEVELLRLPGRSYAELVDAHDSLVSKRRGEVVPTGDALELLLELQRLQVQANVARGIYVPATLGDVEEMKELAEGRRTRG